MSEAPSGGGIRQVAQSPMRLADILFSQGFGTRRICAGLIAGGHVRVHGAVCCAPSAEFDTLGLEFEADGASWPFQERALIMMNKPAGYECSQKPRHHSSVYSLLPTPLRNRDVQAVGRLDADTTGLLLFTDDGALLHRLTSPKHHVPKVYEVGCKHPVTLEQVQRLLDGVMLIDESGSVRAAAAEGCGDRTDGRHGLRLTLTEGKYHQVKRMVAAVGNRVESLHRNRVGVLALPEGLAEGQWTWVKDSELISSRQSG